jgi:hypothetical protein
MTEQDYHDLLLLIIAQQVSEPERIAAACKLGARVLFNL